VGEGTAHASTRVSLPRGQRNRNTDRQLWTPDDGRGLARGGEAIRLRPQHEFDLDEWPLSSTCASVISA
jgi:hypothetical protein